VREVVVLCLTESGIAVAGSAFVAVPVGLIGRGALLEDLAAAMGAEYVVAETEVFVEH